jgi:hypothetical protein
MPPRGRQPLPGGRWQADGGRPPMPRRPIISGPVAPAPTLTVQSDTSEAFIVPVQTIASPPVQPAPPVVPEPTPSPAPQATQTSPPPAPVAPSPIPQPAPAAKVLEFTPTSTFQDRNDAHDVPEVKAEKRQRRKVKIKLTKQVVLPVLVAGVIAALGSGVYAFVGWQASQKDPAVVLRNALTNNLSQSTVEMVTSHAGETVTARLDLSQPANPVVSSETNFQMYGSAFSAESYGTLESGYVRYTNLPGTVHAQTAKSVKNNWVEVRGKDKPAGLDLRLAKLSDPRYQMFGPVLYGSYPESAKQQLVKFMVDQQVYKPTTGELKTTELNGEKVYEMPVKLNVGFLKVAQQSAAASLAYPPQTVQTSVSDMDNYKDGTSTLYISTKEQRVVRFSFSKTGYEATIDYRTSSGSMASQPKAQLAWQAFAPSLWQMKAQAAAKAAPVNLDSERKADIDALHAALASYAAQKGSFPTLAALNDASWMSTVLNAHIEQQRDPLTAGSVLANAPKAGTYAYQPTPTSGKGGCDLKNPCMHYKLTATLSNGQQYSVQDP